MLLIFVGVSQLSLGRPWLRDVGLTSTVGSYTALAFQNPQSIPTHLKTARTRLNVDFTITNASAEAQQYKWTLLVIQGKDTRRAGTGTAYAAAGQTTPVADPIEIECRNGQLQMIISLAKPAEHIDAWMTCNA